MVRLMGIVSPQREIIDAITTQLRTVDAYHLFDPFTNDAAVGAADGIARAVAAGIPLLALTDHDTLAPAADEAAYICNRMKDYGFLISTDGPLHNVLKLKPPIVFSRENADALVDALENVFAEDCLHR